MIQEISLKYDDYKSSGTEWLGFIPQDWNVKRVKDEFNSLDYKRVPLSGEVREKMLDQTYDYYGASGVIDKVEGYIFDGKNILIGEDGANLLMRSSPLAFIANGKYWVNNHAHILKPKKGEIRFFCYLLESFDYTIYISGSAQPKFTAGQLSRVFLTVPALIEQKSIADYLDHKTKQIDQEINLLSQKAEQYSKLKQSLINETVTRGLDKTIRMKGSGVEWIGDIPEHWELKRIKDTTYVKGRIGWQGLRNEDFLIDGSYFCVTGTDLKKGVIDWTNCYFVDENRFNQDRYIQLKVNDILITKDGTIGKIAIIKSLPLPATLNSGVFVTRPIKNDYYTNFMYWAYNSSQFKQYIDLTKGGSTIQHLYQNVFNRFIFTLPPLLEQKDIADYLDNKTKKIDTITQTTNNKISKLKELRKTLINDVVTGKIKVVVIDD